MKKSRLTLFLLLSAFVCPLTLVACSSGPASVIQSSDRNMVSISLKEGTLPEYIVAGRFDEAGIKLVASYSDGTSEEINVTSALVPASYRAWLTTPGTYEITLLFNGREITLNTHIVKETYTVNFYAYDGKPEYTIASTFEAPYLTAAKAPEIERDFYDDGKHYYFVGWDKDFSSITSSLNVYGRYEYIPYYTVTFRNGMDGIIKTSLIDQGESAIEPSEAERYMAGYDFIGWDRDYHNVTHDIDVHGLYVAVSGVDPEQEQSSGEPYIKNPTTIYFMSNFNSTFKQAIDTTIEAFKEVEPNVTVVDVNETGSYNDVKDKVINQIVTQEHPDMFVGYPDAIGNVFEYGVAANIYSFINSETYGWTKADKDDVFPAFLEEGNEYVLSGSYSLPICKSTEALYYNASVLIGLDLSGIDATINNGHPLNVDYLDDLTWEDFFEHLCPALVEYNNRMPSNQKIFGGDDYHVLGYDSDANLFVSLAQQYGYGYISIDRTAGQGRLDFVNDGMKGLMTKFREYYKKNYIVTGGTYANGSYTSDLFANRKTLFCIASTAGASHQYSQDFDTFVARLPRPEGKSRKIVSQGPSVGFLSHKKADGKTIDTDRILASWLFYKFFTLTDNAAEWAVTTGYLPVRSSVAETDKYLEYADISGKAGKAVVSALTAQYAATRVGNDLYATPVFRGSDEAREQMNILVTDCLSKSDADFDIREIFEDAYVNTLKKM